MTLLSHVGMLCHLHNPTQASRLQHPVLHEEEMPRRRSSWSDRRLVSYADSVFGVPAAHLLEIGLPYSLSHL